MIEIEGICFETIVSERVLKIPEAKLGVYNSLQVGIQITNNRSSALYFPFTYSSLIPKMISPDDQVMVAGLHSERLSLPSESDYVLVMPEQTLTLIRDTFLSWMLNRKKKRDRKLTLYIPFPSQDVWGFIPLYPGTYKFWFNYREFSESIEVYSESFKRKILTNIWTGNVLTPPIEICLVES